MSLPATHSISLLWERALCMLSTLAVCPADERCNAVRVACMCPVMSGFSQVVTDPWLRNFIDLECFVLSGMPAKDTICAEMAFMFMERNKPDSSIDYPLGGSAALVDALVRGIEKNGGRVMLRTPVDTVVMEGGRAAGVRLKAKADIPGEVCRAVACAVPLDGPCWTQTGWCGSWRPASERTRHTGAAIGAATGWPHTLLGHCTCAASQMHVRTGLPARRPAATPAWPRPPEPPPVCR